MPQSAFSCFFFIFYFEKKKKKANLSPCPSVLGVGGAYDQPQHVFWIQTRVDKSHARGAAVEDQWAVSLNSQLIVRTLLLISTGKTSREEHLTL